MFLWRLLTLGWAILIFTLSTETFGGSFTAWLISQILSLLHITVLPSTFSIIHFLLRKLAHITEYSVFSILLYRSVLDDPEFAWRQRTALGAVLAAGLYALTDEFHQYFVPGRTASLIDCGIDTVGAALGMLVLYGNDRMSRVNLESGAARKATSPED